MASSLVRDLAHDLVQLGPLEPGHRRHARALAKDRESHLATIYDKLGVTSRAGVLACLLEEKGSPS